MSVKIMSYGGGTNSVGLLCGMVERKLAPPDAILMADTGGEQPHIYTYAKWFSVWLELHNFPAITMVQAAGRNGELRTLEETCLRTKTLPSIAYGYRTCSQRFKIEPQEKWMNHHPLCVVAWELGVKVTKIVGIDYGEVHRARFGEEEKFVNSYPLIDWKWRRGDCVAAIERAGLPSPGKSACFFCPHTKKPEILALQQRYPELLKRALKLEANVPPEKLITTKGLGRRFAWRDFLAGQAPACDEREKEMPCGCYDG